MVDVIDQPAWDRGIRILDFKAALFALSTIILTFLLLIFVSSSVM